MMAEHYLTKTRIDLRQCLDFGDAPALDAHARLRDLLRQHAGEDSARLFAEPLLSRGNDSTPPSVSWYSDASGTAQPFARLDAAQQSALSAELSRRLEPLQPLLADAETGPLVAAALHIADAGSIWSLDGTPVLINWGMLPPDLPRDADSRAAHYQSTLGRFLPLPAAPPLTAAERAALTESAAKSGAAGAVAAGAAAATLAAGAGSAAAASAAPADSHGAAPDTPPPASDTATTTAAAPVPLWAWLPLLLLLLISVAVLIWLLIPGNRIFPEQPRAAIPDETALAASEDVNRALRDRLATLEAALDGATCKSDGTLLMPDGRTIEGLLPPDPSDRSDIPGAIRPASRTAILPPDPGRVQVPDTSGGALDTQSLLTYMEERTAIVLAPSDSGLSSGTGFFVGSDLLVTNFHVIAAPGVNAIYVTNKSLGTIHQAQLLKSMGPFETTGGDFALLRVAGANQPAFDILDASGTLRLQSVIAAGYPGDLLQSDAQFQQLRTGDSTAVPELAVTDGTVSAEQTLNGRARVVVHSAPISQGNSGGPLIDMCGRLVGVNTFVKKGALRNLNFALSGGDLTRFLANTDALPQVVTQVCDPQIRRPEPPQTAAAAPDPQATDTPAPLPQLPALTPQSE